VYEFYFKSPRIILCLQEENVGFSLKKARENDYFNTDAILIKNGIKILGTLSYTGSSRMRNAWRILVEKPKK
jgi:hypothetical protein